MGINWKALKELMKGESRKKITFRYEIDFSTKTSSAFRPGEIIQLIAVVNETIIKYRIGLAQIIQIIRLSGKLSTQGLDVVRYLKWKERIMEDEVKRLNQCERCEGTGVIELALMYSPNQPPSHMYCPDCKGSGKKE